MKLTLRNGHPVIPGTTTTLLSSPGKMPSRAWGITAVKTCPSATFGRSEDGRAAICGVSKEETSCYATKHAYAWKPVQAAQAVRTDWARRASLDNEMGNEFVEILTLAIAREARRQWNKARRENRLDGFVPVFRVHDSGDLFSPSYAYLWLRICQKLPNVQFWFPTRQWRSKNLHMLAALSALNAEPNVAVRPSALYFGDEPPVVDGLAAGTSASSEGFNCPAYSQNNRCDDCRQCWNKTVPVIYRAH